MEKAAYVLCLISILCIPLTHPYTNLATLSMAKFPIVECEFLKLNNIKGNIITEFGLGSYVAYKLYPNNLIYMDGRYEECYDDTEFNKLIEFIGATDLWDQAITDYPTEILMPDKKTNIYEFLLKRKDWKLIFEGPTCGIFVPAEIAKKEYKQPSLDVKYYEKNLFKTNGEFGKKDNERCQNE